MLAILLVWAYITFTAYVAGYLALKVASYYWKKGKNFYNFPLIILCGLATLSMLANYLSLWMPIHLEAGILLLSFSVGTLLIFRKEITRKIYQYFTHIHWLTSGLWICILLFAVLQSIPISYNTPDEAGYYIQTLLWIERYPAIPGLGNLSVCFTYNSSWHTLSCFYRFEYLGFRDFNDLNGYLYVVVGLYALEGFDAILRKRADWIDFVKISYLILAYFFLRATVLSISADVAVAFHLWVILTLVLRLAYQRSISDNQEAHEVYLYHLLVFILTIKLSAITMFLGVLIFCGHWFYKKCYFRLAYGGVVLIVFMFPYLTRNVISSGYLLSPLTLIDVFEVDWKLPKNSGLIGQDYLLSPFLTGTTHHRKLIKDEEGRVKADSSYMSFWEWLMDVQENLYGFWKLWGLGVLGSIPFWLLISFNYLPGVRRGAKPSLFFYMLLVLLWSTYLLWAITLPSWLHGEIRSGLGISLFGISAGLGWLIWRVNAYFNRVTRWVCLALCILLIIKKPYNIENKAQIFSQNLLLPPHYPVAPTQAIWLDGVQLNQVIDQDDVRCWGADVPCVPYLYEGLELRGEQIEEGFRTRRKKAHKNL